jgi:hypothetical protein
MTNNPSNPIYPPYAQVPPPQPPKRHRLRNWLLAVFGAAVLLIVALAIGGGGGGGDTPQGATGPTPTTSAPHKPTPKATTAPAAKHWTTLVTLKGSADKASDTIRTKGGQLRLTYTITGTNGIVGIYLLDEGTDLQTDGGIPVVTTDHPGKDSTLLRKAAGAYYLSVAAANVHYTVTLEELR